MNIDVENIAEIANNTGLSSVRSYRLRMAVILGGLAALGPLSIDMYLPALPGLARDMQTSASIVQLSLTFFLLGLASGQLLAGPLSDIRGRRMPLLAGLIVYSLTSLLCALSPSVWTLIGLRFVQGLAGAAGVVISRAIVRDLYSGTEMTKFVAGLMLVTGAAPVVAPLAGGQLLRFTAWHGVFFVLAVIGLGLTLAVFFGIPETLPVERRSGGGLRKTLSTLRSLAADRVFMGYALSQGFVSAALFAYISGSPFVLQDIYGVSPQVFSLLFAVNSFGIILAGQLTGRLSGIVSETKMFITGIGMSFLGGITLLAAVLGGAGLVFVLPPMFLVVSSMGIVGSAGFSLAMENQRESAGSASGLLGVLSFISGALAAPLAGLGGGRTAVPLGITIAAAGIGAVLCYVFLVRRVRGRV